MPATALYFLGLVLYAQLLAVILTVALVLSLFPSRRATAKNLLAGIFGSFPGVIMCQVAVLPVVALVVAPLFLVSGLTGSGNTESYWIIGISILVAFVCLALVASASIVGFISGWHAGCTLLAGSSVVEAVRFTLAGRILQRCKDAIDGGAGYKRS